MLFNQLLPSIQPGLHCRHIYDSQSQPLEVRWWPALWQPYSRRQAYTRQQVRRRSGVGGRRP